MCPTRSVAGRRAENLCWSPLAINESRQLTGMNHYLPRHSSLALLTSKRPGTLLPVPRTVSPIYLLPL